MTIQTGTSYLQLAEWLKQNYSFYEGLNKSQKNNLFVFTGLNLVNLLYLGSIPGICFLLGISICSLGLYFNNSI